MLEVLTEEVIEHEHEVHDVAQGAAEELYISLCQQLDGYGQGNLNLQYFLVCLVYQSYLLI